MSVQIIITGGDAAESLLELSTLAKGFNAITAASTPVDAQVSAAPAQVAPETPKRARKTKEEPAETGAPDREPAPDEDAPAAGPVIKDDSSPSEPIPSDEDLRALATEIGRKGPEAKKAIKALLDQYGSANITGVPEGKRVAFKRDLEAL